MGEGRWPAATKAVGAKEVAAGVGDLVAAPNMARRCPSADEDDDAARLEEDDDASPSWAGWSAQGRAAWADRVDADHVRERRGEGELGHCGCGPRRLGAAAAQRGEGDPRGMGEEGKNFSCDRDKIFADKAGME
uniref:Uncharacterized protein n=1 Tax=Oryza sativa subsp. japonica TaxID=39947 RepID=Q6F2G8_ORYSJ|nr:hypothetical protein [Oryza sativa Japonica Group]